MPKALLYECFSGMAGDMHLGAMLDLGVPKDHVLAQLGRLELDHEFSIQTEPRKKMGIAGTSVTVELTNVHEHARNLPQINGLISSSSLPAATKSRATSMFGLLAEAEAKVHDIPVEKVHFHEVGAVDAIVDISAAAIALEYLNVQDVYCSGVELGSGMVKCAHGLMPVPAPATALLLEGRPTTRGHVDGEATTPTGATILRHAVNHWENPASFVASKTAYGVGHKDFKRPNVVRVSLGEVRTTLDTETNVCIECNIDDMSPEAYEPLTARLFDLGAKDVFFTPIVMKKSRPGTKVSILVSVDLEPVVIDCVLAHSTTIGLRKWPVSKVMLPREMRRISTALGDVQVKIASLPDGSRRWKVEHDDILRISQEKSMSYLAVHAEVDRVISQKLDFDDGD